MNTKKSYSLNIDKELQKKDISKIDTNNYNNIYFYFYTIKYKNQLPYTLFLLKKEKKKLILPCYNKGVLKKHINEIKKDIDKIGNKKLNKLKKKKYEYKGYIEYDNNLYIFYNSSNLVDVYTYKLKDKYYWCSIYEIFNYRKFLKYKVNRQTMNFLYNNIELFNFYDSKYNKVQEPITIYLEVKKDENLINIINAYDEEKETNYCMHTQNVKKNKNIIRALLFYSEKNNIINNNKFYFPSNKYFSLISIFE